MDSESKELLESTFKLAKENNAMLRKVRNVQKMDSLFALAKFLVIVAIGVGSFYFLQPYIDFIQKFVHDANETIKNINSALPR